jgi:hypothetical protein
MQCDAFDNRLQDLLDARACPEEDPVLAEHAADCPHCRDVLDAQAGLFDTVRDWSVANLEVDLVDRVVASTAARAADPSVHSANPRTWWQTASGRWTALAIAAALVLVAYKGIDRLAPHHGNNAAPVAIDPNSFSKTFPEPRQFAPDEPLEFGLIAREAAEDLGSRLALGVHYIHRGRIAVTNALRGQFSRKASDTPSEHSSSRLVTAAARLAFA